MSHGVIACSIVLLAATLRSDTHTFCLDGKTQLLGDSLLCFPFILCVATEVIFLEMAVDSLALGLNYPI